MPTVKSKDMLGGYNVLTGVADKVWSELHPSLHALVTACLAVISIDTDDTHDTHNTHNTYNTHNTHDTNDTDDTCTQ